ncbi:geminin coiled-coil domain-containing protein 1-like [Salarias fasciatus]|uniref:geminin coiled-coil domain-containing protein 1-like n=1 Tax=Salarias fasciatus TaxID=181472 RepID=UPI0011766C39|nr:geminin coiled-coil domain-containing protein 1-like [Salarias fasciatus]
METLASLWACDPGDPDGGRHEPWAAWEFPPVPAPPPPPAPPLMWMEQLSPHLQRNKQLQDTLLQREEELARLQEENNKLRHFLSSSFVRDLEQKAKKVTSDRRKLKRKLTDLQERSLKNCRPLQVSKRVCRNLTAQFNCSSSESSAYSEPNLDLWVLRTLGLKDRDTIDTSSQSSAENNLRALVYNTVTPSSPPGYPLSPGSPLPTATAAE